MSFQSEINAVIQREVESRTDRNSEVINRQAAILFELRGKLESIEGERDALQQKLDAVVAENAALKEYCAGEMIRAANDIAYAIYNLADMKMTDLKPGIIESTGPAETALIAERNLRHIAAQLRADAAKDGV